jgi:hypothetical protein
LSVSRGFFLAFMTGEKRERERGREMEEREMDG